MSRNSVSPLLWPCLPTPPDAAARPAPGLWLNLLRPGRKAPDRDDRRQARADPTTWASNPSSCTSDYRGRVG
jgi:hypothetical protein